MHTFQVKSGLANEEDVKVITRQIRDRVTQVRRERERRQTDANRENPQQQATATSQQPSVQQQQQAPLQSQQPQQGVPGQPTASTALPSSAPLQMSYGQSFVQSGRLHTHCHAF